MGNTEALMHDYSVLAADFDALEKINAKLWDENEELKRRLESIQPSTKYKYSFCHLRSDSGGVVTVAFRKTHNQKFIRFGCSFCAPEDNFIRKKGREVAVYRLESSSDFVDTRDRGAANILAIINHVQNSWYDVVGISWLAKAKWFLAGETLFSSDSIERVSEESRKLCLDLAKQRQKSMRSKSARKRQNFNGFRMRQKGSQIRSRSNSNKPQKGDSRPAQWDFKGSLSDNPETSSTEIPDSPFQ